jgi:hypothetical protein
VHWVHRDLPIHSKGLGFIVRAVGHENAGARKCCEENQNRSFSAAPANSPASVTAG